VGGVGVWVRAFGDLRGRTVVEGCDVLMEEKSEEKEEQSMGRTCNASW
jgi:hypothetical protein